MTQPNAPTPAPLTDPPLAPRSHTCRECEVGKRRPLAGCPSCDGTGLEGTAFRERMLKAEHKADLLARQVDRYLPCPDHRDKVDGRCYVCAMERAQHAPTPDQVERAARALLRWDNAHSDVYAGIGPWDAQSERTRAIYRTLARRALTAARGGTP